MVQSPNDSDVGRKRNAAGVSENFKIGVCYSMGEAAID
jgi:hypothetical protein